MSDHDTYMALPSLLRLAMERSAGVDGVEAINREKPVPVVMVTAEDWRLIRDHVIALQETISDLVAEKDTARTDLMIDGARRP